MSFTVTLSYPDGPNPLDRFDFTAAATRWADEVGPQVRSALQEAAPKKTGRLASSIRYSRSADVGGLGIEFTANTPYAGYVVHGTRPHTIRPVAARSLHWVNGSGGHFAGVVHHPGTRANDFGRRAVEPMMDDIRQSFRDAISDGVGGS